MSKDYTSQLLVEGTITDAGTIYVRRCPFCHGPHVYKSTKEPSGGVLYVTSVCNVRAAFDQNNIFRRMHAVRLHT